MTQVEQIKKTDTLVKSRRDNTAKLGNYSTLKIPTEQNHINFNPRKRSLGGIDSNTHGKRKVAYHKFHKWGGMK